MKFHKKLLCIFLIVLISQGVIGAIDITRVFGQQLIITLKWRVNAGTGSTWMGPLAADLNNDGLMEIVITGKNGIAALNPTDGSVIWSQPYGGDHVPCEIIDLNKDSIPEILMGPQYINGSSGGVLALHGNNGSVYWYNPNAACKGTYIAVADINADGYPEIYTATPGRITALTYDGRIFASTWTYYPCWGGMSIGDTDFDGVFEVYLGERHTGFDPSARGLRAFWADNLTEIWAHPDVLCSSQAPVLADVDKNGDLEIIVLHQRKGIAVINTDGTPYRKQLTISDLPSNGHTNPTIADVDDDGNLELLHCGQADLGWYTPAIFDLVNWKVEATLPFKSIDPPGVADIDGDGKLEIIAPNQNNVTIFKYNKSTKKYDIIGTIPLAMAHPFFIAQDIDADGKLELVFNQYNSWVSVYDVEAPAQSPLPRSGLHFYSQYRTRVPEYVPPPGPQEPKISQISPYDGAKNVPITLSELSFKLTDYQCDLINYSVITDPDIGSASGINAPNGKITVPVSGLTYSTTYTWIVTATDGTYTTTKTFKFVTIEQAPWYDTRWQYRKKIIIDPTKVIADQTNFPILIDLTDSDLTKAQPDGRDILFTDQNQVKLSHEIEKYNGATGRLIAWVKIPHLSSTSNTILYMYFGNPTCENQQDPTGVWDANYKLVMHLDEETGTLYDSTINGNHGTPYGSLNQGVTGYIGSCVEFNGGYIQLPQVCTSETQFTFSAWIYPRSGARYFISEWWSYQGAFLQVSSDGRYIEFYINNVIVSSTSITLNNWYYIVGTYDGTTARLYVNNRSPTSKSASSPIWPSQNMYIGDRSDHTRKFYGLIDEVRISNIARSAAWILTEYNNQLNPSTFYKLDPEEALPKEPVISKPYPADGATNIPIALNKLSFTLTDYQNDLMNVTVTTNPNIGSLSLTNVPSERYTVTISGLNYATLYTWTIEATDGVYTTTKTFTFTTELAVADDIIFDSKFDMGNLINVTYIGGAPGYRYYKAATKYTIGYDPVAGRTNNDKHWWFYFSMENVAGKTVAVSIVNGTDSDWSTSPTAGNRWPEIEPVYSYDNINWYRVPLSNVTYDRTTKTFAINITVPPEYNKVWLAPLPPYNIARRDALFAEFKDSPYLKVTSLGTTPGGQKLLVATITDPAYPDEIKFRSYVIAQQHSGEVPASWEAEGLIRFLLSDDPMAAVIRRSYIFRIVPIVNVDGVYYGISRYTPIRNGYQYDLNRQWTLASQGSTSSNLQPEIKWIWQDLLAFKPNSFIDLHSTINTEVGSPKEALTYSWSTSDPAVIAFRAKLKEGGWPETVTGTTSYACTVVRNSAALGNIRESVSWESPHDELSTNPGVKLTVHDWMSWGAAWAKGNYLYFGDARVYFVNAGGGSGTTGNPTPSYPSGLRAGDLILLQVTVRDTTNTPSTPSGFKLLFGPDSTGTGRQWIYYKFSDGTESGTLTITIVGSSCKMARMYAFRNVAPENFIEGGGFTSGTGLTISAPSVTTYGIGRLALAFVFVNDDNAVGDFTGETGGNWQEAIPEFTTTAGDDGTIQLQTAIMVSPGTISGGSYAMLAADPWGVRAFALKPAIYTLKINVVGSGSVSINPAKTFYTYGEKVTLEAIPDAYYTFHYWSGDLTGSENPTTITIDKDKNITATFIQLYTLTVNIKGSGFVIKNPDQTGYPEGSVVTLTAVPAAGWSFAGWSGDLSGSANPANITMTSDKMINATFTQDEYTLTVNVTVGGSVTKTPDQPSYTYGTVVWLTANPEPGYAFSHWTGDISGNKNPEYINMTGNKVVAAVFVWTQGNWWDPAWKYRRTITIDHTKVGGELTDFPVLIEIIDISLAGKAQSDGDDFVFTDANGVKLSHEIELYDSATGHLIAWVKVPHLSSTIDTILYLYYGNPNCGNQQNPQGVWDANYKLVMHLDEETGIHYDSTINGNHGTPYGSLVQGVTGYIGSCVEFNGGYIQLPQVCTSETQFTFSAWIYPRSGARYFISEWWSYQGAFLQVSSDGRYIEFYINNVIVSSTSITLNNWYYIVGTYDGTTARLYVNNRSPTSKSASSPIWPSQNMYIGDRSDHTRKFYGLIDEVRISNIARSAAWILTEYNNQLNPSTFYTIGPEEQYAGSSSNSL